MFGVYFKIVEYFYHWTWPWYTHQKSSPCLKLITFIMHMIDSDKRLFGCFETSLLISSFFLLVSSNGLQFTGGHPILQCLEEI